VLCAGAAAVAAVGAWSPAPTATLGSSSTVPTPDPVAPVITPETPVVTQPETPPTTVPEPEPPAPEPEPEPVPTTHTHAPTTHTHPPPQSAPSGLPSALVAVRRCESENDYRAVNPTSGAGGAFQFMAGTWRSVGGTGLPQNASPAEQDRRAALLYAREGLAPWAASRHCWAA